jgi:hypothetical protein
VSQKGKVAGEGAGMFGGAAVLGLLALGTLTTTILALLETVKEDVQWAKSRVKSARR